MIVLDLSILNQKGTPMFNSDTFANRPAFGIVGRIFISIDTAAIYRDTGTAWDLIADGGSSSTNIYNSNGTLSANRVVSSGGFSLTFNPSTTFDTTLTAASNTSSLASFSVNRLSYAASFSSNNIGNLFGGSSSFNLQTFAGSATFANSNIAANSSINSVDFSTGGSTITMTQATGLRVMAGHINMFQYQGTNSGTITHAAVSQNLGFYRPTAATGILTITNAYGHLINALNDYGAGFTFTNRWGIYQAGASDLNYFAANMLLGSTTDNGNRLQVYGRGYINNRLTIDGTTTSQYIQFYNSGSDRAHLYWEESTNSLSIGTYIAGGSIQFETGNNVDAMILTSTGNLGINENNPNRKLYVKDAGTSISGNVVGVVNSNATSGAYINFLAGGSNAPSIGAKGNDITFTDDNCLGTELIRVTGTGNFGLGTATPLGGAGAGDRNLSINSGAGFASFLTGLVNNVKFSTLFTSSTIIVLETNAAIPLAFNTNGIEAARFTSSRNFLINTTTDSGQKLYLNGSLRIDGQTSGSAGGSSGQHLIINCDGTSYKIALLNT